MHILGFVFLFSAVAWGLPPREAFQFKHSVRNPALLPHTFGLNSAQRQAIFDLTDGAVDMRFHYYRDSMTDSILNFLSPRVFFRSIITNDVPPPFFADGDGIGDPQLSSQWWIEKLEVPAAWALATGKGVTIADCDAGYYTDETDLAANLVTEHRFDVADKDDPFIVSDGPWVSHGTSVTAIMAAVLDGKGTNGIAHNAKVVPLQNYNYDSAKDDLDKEEATARCILRAITLQSVKIIVLENQTASGSSETFAGTREAVKLALKAGMTIVSAGGNYSQELKSEAENDTGSIIVGALTRQGTKAFYSNYGTRVSIAAFGEELYTLSGPNGKMQNFGGTSGATPQVAATVALMLEANPKLTPEQIRLALIAARIESPDTKDVGGQLNVLAAVTKAKELIADEGTTRENDEFLARLKDIMG